MLQYVTTNIFDSPAQTLVNTVNTVGVMGKGIAADFKRRYPEMYRRYRELCEQGQLDIGKLYLYRTANHWILNFPTKKHWRNPSKIEYIEAGLQKFLEIYTDAGVTGISFPQLGCGNGNLPWSRVRPLMEKYLKTLPIPVYVHLAKQRAGFVPEHLDAALLAQSQQSRQGLGFEQFWKQLRQVAGMKPANDDLFTEGELPPIVIHASDGRSVGLPGEDFEDLWNSLRLRGALRQDEYPGALREQAGLVTPMLLKLDYIQPMQFVVTDSSGRRVVAGIRFAPPATETESPIIALEAQV